MWYKLAKKKFDTAIVALWLKPEDVKSLGIKKLTWSGGEKSKNDEFHVTMIYLGELSKINRAKIRQKIKKICKEMKPFEVKLGGICRFNNGAENLPIVFPVNASEIEKLRADLVSEMKEIGIEEEDRGLGFFPHMTLGYAPEDFDLNAVAYKNDTILIDRITISWGGYLEHIPLAK